jgi:hypothetical protein
MLAMKRRSLVQQDIDALPGGLAAEFPASKEARTNRAAMFLFFGSPSHSFAAKLVEQQPHVGRLGDERDVSATVNPVFLERREQLELIAGEPHGDLPSTKVGGAVDARGFESNLPHAAVGEDLGDVDQRDAFARAA